MAKATITFTIVDWPVILELFEEALDAVPDWEREGLRDRLKAIIARARARKKGSA